jgi:protein-tyrosine phosphatase
MDQTHLDAPDHREQIQLDARRALNFEGAHNMRDIGGYFTNDGCVTRWGRLLRADSMHGLTRNDQSVLSQYGIGTIVDLRFSSEAQRQPSVYAKSAFVNYTHVPLHEPYADPERMIDSLGGYYAFLVDNCQAQIYRVFGLLTQIQAMPAAVHCTAGKDRTGVIIALVLGALQVPDETIVADYALTERVAAPLMRKLRAEAEQAGMSSAWGDKMFGSDPQHMRFFLRHLQDRYGSAAAYLRLIGVTDAELNRLTANLVARTDAGAR